MDTFTGPVRLRDICPEQLDQQWSSSSFDLAPNTQSNARLPLQYNVQPDGLLADSALHFESPECEMQGVLQHTWNAPEIDSSRLDTFSPSLPHSSMDYDHGSVDSWMSFSSTATSLATRLEPSSRPIDYLASRNSNPLLPSDDITTSTHTRLQLGSDMGCLSDDAAEVCATWFHRYGTLPSDKHISALSCLTDSDESSIRRWFACGLKNGLNAQDSGYQSQTSDSNTYASHIYSSDLSISLNDTPAEMAIEPVLDDPKGPDIEGSCKASPSETASSTTGTSAVRNTGRCKRTNDIRLLQRDEARIYQCTRSCGHKYNRKSDWKRHEETGYPQRYWHCVVCANRGISKIKPSYRKDHFVQHFTKVHPELDPSIYEMESLVEAQTSFPRRCGFCRRRFTSRQERINHIGEHFLNGKCMLEWCDEDLQDLFNGGTGGDDDDNGGGNDDSDGNSNQDKNEDEPRPQDDSDSTQDASGGSRRGPGSRHNGKSNYRKRGAGECTRQYDKLGLASDSFAFVKVCDLSRTYHGQYEFQRNLANNQYFAAPDPYCPNSATIVLRFYGYSPQKPKKWGEGSGSTPGLMFGPCYLEWHHLPPQLVEKLDDHMRRYPPSYLFNVPTRENSLWSPPEQYRKNLGKHREVHCEVHHSHIPSWVPDLRYSSHQVQSHYRRHHRQRQKQISASTSHIYSYTCCNRCSPSMKRDHSRKPHELYTPETDWVHEVSKQREPHDVWFCCSCDFLSSYLQSAICYIYPRKRILLWRAARAKRNTQMPDPTTDPPISVGLLGKGAYSIVEKVAFRSGRDNFFARKTAFGDSDKKYHLLDHEYRLLRRLNHPHIVQLAGESLVGRQPSLFLAPVADSTLRGLLDSVAAGESKVSLATLIESVRGLLSAISYLHERDIVHHDIKPENILVMPRNGASLTFILADFGSAVQLGIDEPRRGDVPITPRYCPPEMEDPQRVLTTAFDIWSLGCIIMEASLFILSGGLPVAPMDAIWPPKDKWSGWEILAQALFVKDVHLQTKATSRLSATVDPDPSKRPSAWSLHELFQATDDVTCFNCSHQRCRTGLS